MGFFYGINFENRFVTHKHIAMKILNTYAFKILMVSVTALFINCKSAQNDVDMKTPLKIGQVYYTNTIQNNQDSRIDVFIPVMSNPNHIQLLQFFFQGKQTNLETSNDNLIVGHFIMKTNRKSDIIMSSDPYAEYGNQVPKLDKPMPFNLKEDECVISYNEGGTIKYFKVSNIIKK